MPPKKWYWNDIMDGLLRRLYDPTVRGRSQEIAARLKVPRWAVNRRAAGLSGTRSARTCPAGRDVAIRSAAIGYAA